jgi:hypothetical protein
VTYEVNVYEPLDGRTTALIAFEDAQRQLGYAIQQEWRILLPGKSTTGTILPASDVCTAAISALREVSLMSQTPTSAGNY